AAGSIVQAFVLKNRKMVRRIVLLNSTTRPHPSLRERFLAWAEKNLPLGLPFRLGSLAFDSRCFLQRIRCPALVLVTGDASQYVRQQAEYLSSHLPTSWFSELLRGSTLSEKIELFLDVPAKCPQKNR
ncbi:MAG: hypothetical protein H6619_04530, partial [Deltaproteobacteria bacterium]|nr:hypothetical protein [Deltaproteobacteria bacterium]